MKISDERLQYWIDTYERGIKIAGRAPGLDEFLSIFTELQQLREERDWKTWENDGHPPTGKYIEFLNVDINTTEQQSWSDVIAKFNCKHVMPEPGEQEFEGDWYCQDQGGIIRDTELMRKMYPYWRLRPMNLPEAADAESK